MIIVIIIIQYCNFKNLLILVLKNKNIYKNYIYFVHWNINKYYLCKYWKILNKNFHWNLFTWNLFIKHKIKTKLNKENKNKILQWKEFDT